jgi:hypothetical protein
MHHAVGINLTAASHVFIMEPCLNPALEEQAIGRSWRMGQQRTVVVKRFYTKVCGSESVVQSLQDVALVLMPGPLIQINNCLLNPSVGFRYVHDSKQDSFDTLRVLLRKPL